MTDQDKTALLSKLRAPVASAEVMDALNWVDDFIARCNRDDRGSCESVNVLRRALASVPVADERKETAGVTLDGCLETLFRVGEHLGIDYAESRKQPGAPSGIYIKAIEDRISQAMNAAREEAAKLMDQTSRSSGATLIRSPASAPVAGEATAWMHEEDQNRVISAQQKAQAERDGGAYASSLRPYSIPLFRYAAPQASEAARDADRQQASAPLLKAARRAVLALAAAAERDPAFQGDYDALSTALSAQPGAQVKEQSDA